MDKVISGDMIWSQNGRTHGRTAVGAGPHVQTRRLSSLARSLRSAPLCSTLSPFTAPARRRRSRPASPRSPRAPSLQATTSACELPQAAQPDPRQIGQDVGRSACSPLPLLREAAAAAMMSMLLSSVRQSVPLPPHVVGRRSGAKPLSLAATRFDSAAAHVNVAATGKCIGATTRGSPFAK